MKILKLFIIIFIFIISSYSCYKDDYFSYNNNEYNESDNTYNRTSYYVNLNKLRERAVVTYNAMSTIGYDEAFLKIENNIQQFNQLIDTFNLDFSENIPITLNLVATKFGLLAQSYDSIAATTASINKEALLLLDEMNKITKDADTLAAEAAGEAFSHHEQLMLINAKIALELDETEKHELET